MDPSLICWAQCGSIGSMPARKNSVEYDALGQRQFAGIVESDCRALAILLPWVGARFTTAARMLFTTERTANFCANLTRNKEVVTRLNAKLLKTATTEDCVLLPAPDGEVLTLTRPQSDPLGPIHCEWWAKEPTQFLRISPIYALGFILLMNSAYLKHWR